MHFASFVLLVIGACQSHSPDLFSHELRGRIIDMSKKPPSPVPSARIKVLSLSFKKETTTDSDGMFFLSLPQDEVPGKPLQIIVDARAAGKQLQLFKPLDGRITIPEDYSIDIGLLPEGNVGFYYDAEDVIRLANHQDVKKLIPKAAAGASSAGVSAFRFDLDRFLEQFSKEHRLDPSRLARRVVVWAQKTEHDAAATDEQRALAAFANKEFAKASRLFEQTGKAQLQALKEIREQKEKMQEKEKAIQRDAAATYTRAGDSDLSGGFFEKALTHYDQALELTNRDVDHKGWVNLKLKKIISYSNLGSGLFTTIVGNSPFDPALKECQQLLDVYKQDTDQDFWAMLQFMKALLLLQKTIKEPQFHESLLPQALDAINNTLIVVHREEPEMWGGAQMLLGVILSLQAEWCTPVQCRSLRAQAQKTFQNALQVSNSIERSEGAAIEMALAYSLIDEVRSDPGEESDRMIAQAVDLLHGFLRNPPVSFWFSMWMGTQNSLAMAFLAKADQSAGNERQKWLGEAVQALNDILQQPSSKQFPKDLAAAKTNLTIVLFAQADEKKGQEKQKLLVQAAEESRNAIRLLTQKGSLKDWANAQFIYGRSLIRMGNWIEGRDAYEKALLVVTCEKTPGLWVEVESYLSNSFVAQSQRSENKEAQTLLAQAAETYRKALETHCLKESTEEWARLQSEVGLVLVYQGLQNQKDPESRPDETQKFFREAERALNDALAVLTLEAQPEIWAFAQYNLGIALLNDANCFGTLDNPALLTRAIRAFRSALQVQTRERNKQEWAENQHLLGMAFEQLADLTASDERAKQTYMQAVQAFSCALEVNTNFIESRIHLDRICEMLEQEYGSSCTNITCSHDIDLESSLNHHEAIK